jgi:hypothetical protein
VRQPAAWVRPMAGVAGVVIAIGSCLRWLTVTGPFTGPIAVDKSSGLHDLGYATGTDRDRRPRAGFRLASPDHRGGPSAPTTLSSAHWSRGTEFGGRAARSVGGSIVDPARRSHPPTGREPRFPYRRGHMDHCRRSRRRASECGRWNRPNHEGRCADPMTRSRHVRMGARRNRKAQRRSS